MVEILYIPGLNTYGDGQIHFGPLRFGKMHSHIEEELLKHDIRLVSIEEKNLKTDQFHTILAHSQGGLKARTLAHDERFSHIKRIITIASPHFGTPLAERALNVGQQNQLLAKIFRWVNYDLNSRVKYFAELTPAALKTFNESYPDIDTVTYYSVLSAPKTTDLNLVFHLLTKVAGLKLSSHERFDGLIPLESQKWGVPLGNFDLDHLAQIGFFRHIISRKRRAMINKQFKEMIALIASVAKTS